MRPQEKGGLKNDGGMISRPPTPEQAFAALRTVRAYAKDDAEYEDLREMLGLTT